MSNDLSVNMRRAEMDRAADDRRRENRRREVQEMRARHESELASYLRQFEPAVALIAELRAVYEGTEHPVACPHWEPGRITMRKGCTACAAEAAAVQQPADVDLSEGDPEGWVRGQQTSGDGS